MEKKAFTSFAALYEEIKTFLHKSDESIFVRFRKFGWDWPLEIEAVTETNLCGSCTCEVCQFCSKFDWLHGQSALYFGQEEIPFSALEQKIEELTSAQCLAFARIKREKGDIKVEVVSGSRLCAGCSCSSCAYCHKFNWLQGLPV